MMKRLMIKAACICVLFLPALSFASTFEYFGLSDQPPVSNKYGATVCLLDKAKKIKIAIEQDLRTQMAVKEMSGSEIAARYENQFKALSESFICQYKAAESGVERLPAIVINHRYVIYGQPNIDLAAEEYQAYLERDHVE